MRVESPRPAATVVVLRDSDVGPQAFLVQRHRAIAFTTGAHVFPGGRVDPIDRETVDPLYCNAIDLAGERLPDLDRVEAGATHVAAARELFEEAGILLARDRTGQFVSLADSAEHERFRSYRHKIHAGRQTLGSIMKAEGIRLALDALHHFAHWLTPAIETRRYDTHFFAARVPPHQHPAHDDSKTIGSVWMTPADALAAARRREILLPPPTWITLREIKPFPTVDHVLRWASQRQVLRRQPQLREDDGRRVLIVPGDRAHPEPYGEPVDHETRFVWHDDRWDPADS